MQVSIHSLHTKLPKRIGRYSHQFLGSDTFLVNNGLTKEQIQFNFTIRNWKFVSSILAYVIDDCYNCEMGTQSNYNSLFCYNCGQWVGNIVSMLELSRKSHLDTRKHSLVCRCCGVDLIYSAIKDKFLHGKFCIYCGKNRIQSFIEKNGKQISIKQQVKEY